MSNEPSRALRVDLIIALCALVVSCLAAGAAVYQGHVIASQLSVTVWPYVNFRESAGNAYVEVDVQNVGSGPAIIGSATFYVDGKPQSSLSRSLRTLGFKPQNGSTVTLTNLGPGAVIRSGDSVPLLRVDSKQFAALAADAQRRTRIEVCYCSMLQQCWHKATGDDYPTQVHACDRSGVTAINT
ncbi:MAG TPA: hypothetical protein VEV38_03790 [Candidatus Eremiobacteraceae bacterium]|nr:hypothetical protein [Candidatus Eremiobacteraceae bacterium]